MNFITDLWFYAWAIPAVIITGISKTGLGAGVGGVAVPMMSQVIAPGAAAGIMLPILCVMDVLGLRAYRGKWEWQGVKHMMLPAILGIEAWFGTTRECVDAAVTGRWRGELT